MTISKAADKQAFDTAVCLITAFSLARNHCCNPLFVTLPSFIRHPKRTATGGTTLCDRWCRLAQPLELLSNRLASLLLTASLLLDADDGLTEPISPSDILPVATAVFKADPSSRGLLRSDSQYP